MKNNDVLPLLEDLTPQKWIHIGTVEKSVGILLPFHFRWNAMVSARCIQTSYRHTVIPIHPFKTNGAKLRWRRHCYEVAWYSKMNMRWSGIFWWFLDRPTSLVAWFTRGLGCNLVKPEPLSESIHIFATKVVKQLTKNWLWAARMFQTCWKIDHDVTVQLLHSGFV